MHAVMHVTGFIRAWPPAGYGSDSQTEPVDDVAMAGAQAAGSGSYCLVAVARLQVSCPSFTVHLVTETGCVRFKNQRFLCQDFFCYLLRLIKLFYLCRLRRLLFSTMILISQVWYFFKILLFARSPATQVLEN